VACEGGGHGSNLHPVQGLRAGAENQSRRPDPALRVRFGTIRGNARDGLAGVGSRRSDADIGVVNFS
jgi:hypothetical protein